MADIYLSHVRKTISALYRLICDYHDRMNCRRPLPPDLELVWQRSMGHFKRSIQCMDYVHTRTECDPVWHVDLKSGSSENRSKKS